MTACNETRAVACQVDPGMNPEYLLGKFSIVNERISLNSCVWCVDPSLTPAADFLVQEECPAGYFKYRDSCISLNEESEEKTWEEAEKYCQSKGGHLMSITDEYEFHLLAYLERNLTAAANESWVGLHLVRDPRNGEQSYEYTDGWPAYRIPWGKNQPNASHLEEEHYVYESEGSYYTTTDKDLKLPFLCKIHLNPDNRPSVPDYSHLVCPKEQYASHSFKWYDLDPRSQYCYWISDIVQTSGNQARESCHRLNASLVSFHSDHELKAVDKLSVKMLEGDVWIGLFRERYNGPWRWDDGSEVEFENWEGLPALYWDCAYMNSKTMKWSGTYCNWRAAHFICATPKVERTLNEEQSASKTSGKSAGIAVGVIIAILVLVALAGAVFWIQKNSGTPSPLTKISWKRMNHRSNSLSGSLTSES